MFKLGGQASSLVFPASISSFAMHHHIPLISANRHSVHSPSCFLFPGVVEVTTAGVLVGLPSPFIAVLAVLAVLLPQAPYLYTIYTPEYRLKIYFFLVIWSLTRIYIFNGEIVLLSKCGVCWVKMSSAGSVSGGTKDTTPLIRRSGGINSRSSSTSSLYVIRSLAVFSSPAIFPAQNVKSLTCAEEVTANCALLVSLPLFFYRWDTV